MQVQDLIFLTEEHALQTVLFSLSLLELLSFYICDCISFGVLPAAKNV